MADNTFNAPGKGTKKTGKNSRIYRISDRCVACGECAGACPVLCIDLDTDAYIYQIGSGKCISCGRCFEICPVGAVEKS